MILNLRRTLCLIIWLFCFNPSIVNAEGPQYYYCYAVDHGSGNVYVSDIHETGPVPERRSYGSKFVQTLNANRLLPAESVGYCVMRATDTEIKQSQIDLRQHCHQCGGAEKFNEFIWVGGGSGNAAKNTPPLQKDFASQDVTRTPATPRANERLSYDKFHGLGDTLGLLVTAPLIPESENAAVQLRTKFFLCDGNIILSYSLQPVPGRKITSIRFRGSVTGPDNARFQFDGGQARYVDQHRLGCDYQRVFISSISRYGDIRRFKSTLSGSNEPLNAGHVEWFLSLFFPSPYPAPWPEGSIGKPD